MRIRSTRPAFLFSVVALAAALSLPVKSFADGPTFIRDAEAEHIIRLYATPLFKAAAVAPDSVKIVLVNDSSLNAFVANGKTMFINTGLIDAADTAEQVIGVIAHETGHIAAGHLARLKNNIDNANITSWVATALGILGGLATGDPALGQAVMAGGQQLAVRNLLSYTRINENEADQIALRLLDDTRQSAEGLLNFFEKLGAQEALFVDSRYVDPYVRTHPLTRERIATVRAHVQNSPYTRRQTDPELQELHERMRAKLRAFLNPPARTLRQYPTGDESVPARYARAILHLRQGDRQLGLPLIEGLIQQEPRNPFFHELRGQLLFETGQVRDALPSLERSVDLAPHEPLLRILFAHALVEAGRPDTFKKALQNLNAALVKDRNIAFAWRLAAKAYYSLGDDGLAAYADAELNLLTGDKARAAASARRASELLEKNSPPWVEAQYILRKTEED